MKNRYAIPVTRNPQGKMVAARISPNIAAGFVDEDGIFHPIRSSFDYSRERAGEKVKVRGAVKKRKPAKKKAAKKTRR